MLFGRSATKTKKDETPNIVQTGGQKTGGLIPTQTIPATNQNATKSPLVIPGTPIASASFSRPDPTIESTLPNMNGGFNRFEMMRNNPDFSVLSLPSSNVPAPKKTNLWKFWEQPNKPEEDLYNFINNVDGYRDMVAATSAGTNQMQQYGDFTDYSNLNDSEIELYNYLYNTAGSAEAEEYLGTLGSDLSQRRFQQHTDTLADMATEHPVLMSAASVPVNLVGGAVSALDLAGQNINRALTGEPVNYHSIGQQAGASGQAIRSPISQMIEDNTEAEVAGRNVGSFVYDTGMSAADSLLAAGVSGNPWVGAGALSTVAGTATARDIAARGGTDNQALVGGLAAGTFEALFERVSIGQFKALQNIPVQNVKAVVGNIAKTMGVNASEEAATEAANIVFDSLAMGDISNYEISIRNYMDSGMSEEEAKQQTVSDMMGQIAEAGASGALMGFGFGSIGSAQSAIQNRGVVQETEGTAEEGAAQEGQEGIDEQTGFDDGDLIFAEDYGDFTDLSLEREFSSSTNQSASDAAQVQSIQTPQESQGQSTSSVTTKLSQELAEPAKTFGKEGSKAFTNSYNGGNIADYYAAFATMYQAGMTGRQLTDQQAARASVLPEVGRLEAYKAGIADSAATASNSATVQPPVQDAGLVQNEYSKVLSQETATFFDQISRATGTRIEMVAPTGANGANGWYKDGVISIASDAENAGAVVARHEVTHRLQEIAPEAYTTYRNYAVNAATAEAGQSVDLVQAYQRRYADSGVTLTTEQAMDEIAADFTERLFGDSTEFTALAKADRNVAQRLLDSIKEFIQRVTDAVSGRRRTQDAVALAEYGVDMATLEEAARLWEVALNEGTTNVSTSQSESVSQEGAAQEATEETAEKQKEEDVEEGDGTQFSMKGTGDIAGEVAQLQKENDALRRALDRYKGQLKETDRPTNNKNAVKKAAREIVKEYTSRVEVSEISEDMQNLYDSITDGTLEFQEAMEKAREIASVVIQNSYQKDDQLYSEYSTLRKYLRSTKIKVDDSVKSEIADWGDFRKKNMGRINFTNEGTPVDVVYLELAEIAPEFFNEDVESNPTDQVERIAEIASMIYDVIEFNPYSSEMDQAISYAANEIMARFFDIPQVKPTFADRKKRELNSAVAEGRRRVEEEKEKSSQAEAFLVDMLSKEERTEKRIKAARARRDATVKRLIEKRKEAVKSVKYENKEKQKEAKKKQERREMVAKITRKTKALSKMLLRPTDDKHIPEQLKTTVATLLQAINMESSYSGIIAERYAKDEEGKYIRDENGEKVTELGVKYVPKGTKNAAETEKTIQFRKLRDIYSKMADVNGDSYDLIVDVDLTNNLMWLEEYGETPISTMSSEALGKLLDVISAVETSIKTANMMVGISKFIKVSDLANGIRDDNTYVQSRRDGIKGIKNRVRYNREYASKYSPPKTEYRKFFGSADKLINFDMMTPQAYFYRIGDAGYEMWQMMRRSQDKYIQIIKESKDKTEPMIKGLDIRKLEKAIEPFMIGDRKLILSKAQIMSLYVLEKREQAKLHIYGGGIRPAAIDKKFSPKKIARPSPVEVTKEDVARIIDTLTVEEKAAADAMQEYLSKELKKYGNEASMEVYGYKKFLDEFYFPIDTDEDQTKTDISNEAIRGTVAGRGMAQATNPNANNALVISSIFDVYSNNVNEMATYSAWLATMENMRRVLNFKFRKEEDSIYADGVQKPTENNVKEVLRKLYGNNGTAYFTQLMGDINQGVRLNNVGSVMDSIVGNFKATSVAANLRVIFQQPTAIIRAMSLIAPHHFVATPVTIKDWNRVMKYAPIAQWKSWGYFDTQTGRNIRDVILESETKMEKFKQVSMSGAAIADSVAWTHLWKAVENETKARNKELTPGTDEFYKAVAVRFNEAIDKTQVVDGIIQRSQIMRSPDSLNKMASSFMSEPTKTYNMALNAAVDMRKAKSKAAKKKARKNMAYTTMALTTSFAVNAVAQSVIDALRDDDKEMDYWEKFISAYFGFTGEEETNADYWQSFWSGNLQRAFNPFSYIPYVRDVASLIDGFDVTRMDMEPISKVIDAAVNMASAMNGEGAYSKEGAFINLVSEGSRFFGVPVANVKRDVHGALNTWAIEQENYLMQYELDTFFYSPNGSKSSMFMDLLYNAMVNDQDAYEIMYDDLVKRGVDPEKIKSNMERRMQEAQGVTLASEMDRRYLSPTEERLYAVNMSYVTDTNIWEQAKVTEREDFEDTIYGLVTKSASGTKLQDEMHVANQHGISSDQYLMYQLALDVANNDLNEYTNQEEATAAIDMILGLTQEQRSYLWRSTNKSWSDWNNPYV